MKHHGLGTYPMYHIERILESNLVTGTQEVKFEKRRVELCHTTDIDVGDTIQYKHHKDLVMTVTEILESNIAKGNHPDPNTKWYNLILEYNKAI